MAAMKKLALFPVILLLVLSLVLPACAADKPSATELIALAKAQSLQLREAIEATFTAKDLPDGTAWAGHGSDFFFAVESATPPSLVVDDFAGSPTEQIAGSNLWYASAQIEPVGRMHQFHYLIRSEERRVGEESR